ncbi:sugar phosphate isomerase/epimerase family protein [Flavilitoribacter nigricans]|uniref:Xylose isomerase n=1 Tax=Flavilitoribacter nigricans (strain ATCC 23147 / DSM 23189 / NBRC 102662 / NCIMB 1420 / SS-2) TaxID=1122177 RepID=A0A2D0NEZ8_FLAN2|nr:sugar phosphate isomerase/epimerase family protein [Flavilitoribacter nigricans]PHN07094.1 xylose isomerase [Flavilitoribacter nigricans DSM 23189 = NBRC 102662]
MMLNRRYFLRNVAVVGSAIGLSFDLPKKQTEPLSDLPISCQQYPWQTFLEREGKEWKKNLAASMEQVAASGFTGFEPSINSIVDIGMIQPFLSKNKLQSPSIYVNSTLHDPEESKKNVDTIVRLAQTAKALGVEIIVTNPDPIRWGGDEDKTDAQLQVQAKALNELGAGLRAAGLRLAYHNHDAEMRNSAREFHHMMLGTDPENVGLCLDAHWIYRGSGNSQVALFDIVKLYQDRIVELHLRQSKNGIWTEAFGPGDIDYEKLAGILAANEQKPHLVLEQAIEKGSPKTMTGLEAHQLGLAYTQKIFADFGK